MKVRYITQPIADHLDLQIKKLKALINDRTDKNTKDKSNS